MCDVAILNPSVDMNATPACIVPMVDAGFFSPQSWSNSPSELSPPQYGGSPIASPPSARSPTSSLQHSPAQTMPSPNGSYSPAHSPIMQQMGSPVHVKQEGEYSCSTLSALLSKPAAAGPPELVPIFSGADTSKYNYLHSVLRACYLFFIYSNLFMMQYDRI